MTTDEFSNRLMTSNSINYYKMEHLHCPEVSALISFASHYSRTTHAWDDSLVMHSMVS